MKKPNLDFAPLMRIVVPANFEWANIWTKAATRSIVCATSSPHKGELKMHIRKSALLSLLALALATGWLAKSLAQKPTPRVWLYKSSESASALAKGPSVKIAEDRAGNGVYTIMMAKRTKAGEVELHSLDTDIFYVINGDATFITGGKAEGMKPTGDNEER